MLCLVFPMGLELGPFLRRVEVKSRWNVRKATYREVFFEGRRLLLVRCGVGPERAAAAVRNLRVRPTAILSVGTAGALVAGISVGHLVVASETVSGNGASEQVRSSEELVTAVAAACRKIEAQYRVGPMVTVNDAVWLREDRERLHRQTGALAVEMESHAVSTEASRLGVPVASLRVVSDDISYPPLPDYRKLKHFWRRPAELPSTLAAVYQWWQFLRSLRSVVEVLPPVLVRMIRDTW